MSEGVAPLPGPLTRASDGRRSGEQRLAVPVARLAETGWHREQPGADMLDVLIEQVALAEQPLDRYELARGSCWNAMKNSPASNWPVVASVPSV